MRNVEALQSDALVDDEREMAAVLSYVNSESAETIRNDLAFRARTPAKPQVPLLVIWESDTHVGRFVAFNGIVVFIYSVTNVALSEIETITSRWLAARVCDRAAFLAAVDTVFGESGRQ